MPHGRTMVRDQPEILPGDPINALHGSMALKLKALCLALNYSDSTNA